MERQQQRDWYSTDQFARVGRVLRNLRFANIAASAGSKRRNAAPAGRALFLGDQPSGIAALSAGRTAAGCGD